MARKRRYVCGICQDPTTGRVLLIEKKRPLWQAGKLNGIGGKIESYETPAEAMVREFKEETGLTVTDWKPFLFLADSNNEANVYFFKGIADLTGYKNTTDEILFEVDPKNLPANILDTMEWLIPMSLSPQSPTGSLEIY